MTDERKEMRRPAKPGMSIGHYKVSAGTFGAVVRDRSTGKQLILSNNHVLANLTNGADNRARMGDAILQPGTFDGGDLETTVIGKFLERFCPLHCETIIPRCRIAQTFEEMVNKFFQVLRPRYKIRLMRENEAQSLADCAVAAPVSPDAVDANILEVGPIAGIKKAQFGMIVKKSGRSSGLTTSVVLATEVTARVAVSRTEYSVFADQILAGAMSLPGDSGSLVLSEDNHAVGLLICRLRKQ